MKKTSEDNLLVSKIGKGTLGNSSKLGSINKFAILDSVTERDEMEIFAIESVELI